MQKGVAGYVLGVSTPLRMFDLPGMQGLPIPFSQDENKRDGDGNRGGDEGGSDGNEMWPKDAVPSPRLKRFASEMNELQISCASSVGGFQQ